MGLTTSPLQNQSCALSAPIPCRLVVRKEDSLAEISQFVIAGLQVGQQVVAMAGPKCLREIASSLHDASIRPEAMLRSARLVFLTAPDCLADFSRPEETWHRGPLRRTAPLLRWVSDWSWAYSSGWAPSEVLAYQLRVHDFVRGLGALSLCTVQCRKLERSSLLAVLADHRRVTKSVFQA